MENLYLSALITLIGSFILIFLFIPKIIWIVNSRDLIDDPNHRSSHKKSTPTMAGVAFFLTLIFGINFIGGWDSDIIGINLIASLTLVFAIGLKDDLVMSSPKAKIGGELLAIAFVLFSSGLQVTTLNGFLGIQNIPIVFSYILITLMILTIINSFNMIDGIDGLASIIGVVIFSLYGIIFFTIGYNFYFLLCLCLIGILSAYLRYNFSSKKKIFMGDTGSLIIGFSIGFLSLKFLSIEASVLEAVSFIPENKLFTIAAIFYIPLFDTLRVIGVRLIQKKSPFFPDNNHIHHILINSGLKHYQASMFLGFLNLILAISFIALSTYFNSFQMLGFLVLSFGLLLVIFHQLKINIKSQNRFGHLVRAIQFFF